MKALVVGGAGYIGSHMVRMLSRAGHQVAVMDNFSTGHAEAIEGYRLYRGDLLAPADIDRALADYRPDLVMHFAARSMVAESMAEPMLYHHNNAFGVLNLLDSMRRHDVSRLMFSSTAAVYGVPIKRRIEEDHPTAPINPYGWSKLFAEHMIHDHCRAYGLRAVVLRYFNAAGADESGEIGESHVPETHLIPSILRAAAGAEQPTVKLFGNDYDTRDGYAVRDFIHVTDLCEAHLLAAQALSRTDLPDYQLYNLGNGQGFSVLEVLNAAQEIIGRKVETEICARRPGDPPVLVADASRARAVLGWAPKTHSLQEIVESAWRWHRAQRY
ncbi:UDP-glucose 4-epimerase GalE [Hydrocarboniphaga effusa]|uniref:UDP-glucose 4-epimerase GalE n=1 Tax=Hydrocarboniphaga effusa TaxID=243629 RepID=UPI0035AF8FAC